MREPKETDILPKQTVVGDRVRIREASLPLYLRLYSVTKDQVFQIVGHREINGRNVWRVSGDGPSELFSGHVTRAWGSLAERLEGLRASGWKP